MATQHIASAGSRRGANKFLGWIARQLRRTGKLRTVILCAGTLILVVLSPALPAQEGELQQKGIRVLVPLAGRYMAEGSFAFAPGSAASPENIRILRTGSTYEEVPSMVSTAASWLDGSVKLAKIVFPIKAEQEGSVYFWVEWGPEVRRAEWQAPVSERRLQTVYFEEAEVPSPGFDLEAGTLVVRVERHPDLWYYSFLIPVAGIIVVLVWRKVKLSR